MENMTFPETFRWNPVGNQSHSVESGQQPKASLAWGHASALHRWCILPAKRRQRRCRTMLLSPEISVADVLVLSGTGDRTVASKWPDVNGSAGVAGTWGAPTGVLQEQERLVTFRVNDAALGGAAPKPPGPRSRPVDRRESGPGPVGTPQTDAGNARYRRTKPMSSLGGGGRGRSVSIVPKSAGRGLPHNAGDRRGRTDA